MNEERKPRPGSLGWLDLTVENADEVRDFYAAVVGWKPEPVDMGEYSDYNMNSPVTGDAVAGVCHARGVNTGLPAQWMPYFTVADLDTSVAQVTRRGGKVIVEPRGMGSYGRYCVVQDPGGAAAALFEPA